MAERVTGTSHGVCALQTPHIHTWKHKRVCTYTIELYEHSIASANFEFRPTCPSCTIIRESARKSKSHGRLSLSLSLPLFSTRVLTCALPRFFLSPLLSLSVCSTVWNRAESKRYDRFNAISQPRSACYASREDTWWADRFAGLEGSFVSSFMLSTNE